MTVEEILGKSVEIHLICGGTRRTLRKNAGTYLVWEDLYLTNLQPKLLCRTENLDEALRSFLSDTEKTYLMRHGFW